MRNKNLINNSILREREILAPYTTLRIGGPARLYYSPQDNKHLAKFLQNLPVKEPLLWLGLGSNMLICDSGFHGTVIHTQKMPSNIDLISDNTIQASAGTPCAKISKFAIKNNLAGAEFFAGIPGTIGGALSMNAGAFGCETWNYVVKVGVINRQGKIIIRKPNEYKISYRTAIGPSENEWFIFVYLSFTKKANKIIKQMNCIKKLLHRRKSTQPIGLPSCGSVFRNPSGQYAGALIEASKLKGKRIGGAEVSSKHANFIINIGGATALDVKTLISEIKQCVFKDHRIELEPEVKYIGF